MSMKYRSRLHWVSVRVAMSRVCFIKGLIGVGLAGEKINFNAKIPTFSLDIMRQTACLVVNPIIVDGYASLLNCTTAVRASDSMMASS